MHTHLLMITSGFKEKLCRKWLPLLSPMARCFSVVEISSKAHSLNDKTYETGKHKSIKTELSVKLQAKTLKLVLSQNGEKYFKNILDLDDDPDYQEI